VGGNTSHSIAQEGKWDIEQGLGNDTVDAEVGNRLEVPGGNRQASVLEDDRQEFDKHWVRRQLQSR
jgi:hypothetical protein